MASIFKRKDRKKKYGVSYFDPHKQKRDQKLYYTKLEREQSFARWNLIELKYFNNDPSWRDMYEVHGDHITLKQLFHKFELNKIANIKDPATKAKYRSTMKSALDVYGENVFVHQIPTMERNGKIGWEIYKSEREIMGRARTGINSYLNELQGFFDWAKRRKLIDDDIIVKDDLFPENEIDAKQFKEWTNEEIELLHSHPGLNEYQKDMLFIYIYTGFRVNQLTGVNKAKPWQVLQWEHVNFDNGTVMIAINKRRKPKGYREPKRLHPSAMVILKKWKEAGLVQPIPMTYKMVRKMIREISDIISVEFTAHDLRRLNGQLAEEYFHSMEMASKSLGHTNTNVTKQHYASTSFSTQDYINDGVAKQLHHKTDGNKRDVDIV
jgi:integrase